MIPSDFPETLRAYFEDELSNYWIESQPSSTAQYFMGPGGGIAAQAQFNTNYSHMVTVELIHTVASSLKGFNRKELRLGEYEPIRIERHQELITGTIVSRISYTTDDLTKFALTVKNLAWGKFNSEFTQQLEIHLNESD